MGTIKNHVNIYDTNKKPVKFTSYTEWLKIYTVDHIKYVQRKIKLNLENMK